MVYLGLAIQNTKFKPGTNASIEVLAFRKSSGGDFNTVTLNAAWSNDTRDSRLLPTKGQVTLLASEFAVPGTDLSYYKLNARHQQFFPLFRNITGSIKGEVGYGDGFGDTEVLPLTENYFGGGIRSLRGYEANTLGPRDSHNDPLGGDLKVIANFDRTQLIRVITNLVKNSIQAIHELQPEVPRIEVNVYSENNEHA